eukprot:scaffold43269_cov24-Tisochrysis_lutea.AAC.4
MEMAPLLDRTVFSTRPPGLRTRTARSSSSRAVNLRKLENEKEGRKPRFDDAPLGYGETRDVGAPSGQQQTRRRCSLSVSLCNVLHSVSRCVHSHEQVTSSGFTYANQPWFAQALHLLAQSGAHGVAVDVWYAEQAGDLRGPEQGA